jgi:hypothetical protein
MNSGHCHVQQSWRTSTSMLLLLRMLCGMNLLGLITSMASPLPVTTIQRMTPQQYRQERLRNGAESMDRPILIEQALSSRKCEQICEKLVHHGGSTPIQLQRKTALETTIYDVTLEQSLSLMMDSTPSDAVFCFVEGLLDTHAGLQSSKRLLQQTRESLFPSLIDNNNDDLEEPSLSSANWFDYFPDYAIPSDCVVIAGHGATSTFHRDPFEWTGTSLCLEGRKLWRFLPPTPLPPDDLLESYRLNSIAWNSNNQDTEQQDNHAHGDSEFVLSAGWQSDFALFTSTTSTTNPNPDKVKLVHPRELAEKSESEADAIVENMAACSISLPPNLPPGLTCSLTNNTNNTENTKHVSYLSVMQKQGDLLLIPAHWYHQTYAPEPSLAVASQRCGSWEARRVLDHILALQDDTEKKHDIPKELLLQACYEDQDAKSTVELLFDYLQGVVGKA